jgi:tRNA(fMet)-specific endonuclease VapC
VAEPLFMLDSNICIYVLEALAEKLRPRIEACAPGQLVASAISHAEVWRGVELNDPIAVGKVKRLYEIVNVVPFDEQAARRYVEIAFKRHRFDRLIAAHALALDLTLITNNEADFADVPGLRVENWTV